MTKAAVDAVFADAAAAIVDEAETDDVARCDS